jgi:hypothetical protein
VQSLLSYGSAELPVMTQVPSGGAFVRALLPVSPTGGYTATVAVRVTIDPAGPPSRPRRNPDQVAGNAVHE